MFPKEMIVIFIVLIILSVAIISILKMRKKGIKCIGCPQCSQGNCSGNKTGSFQKINSEHLILLKNVID
ncbi:FeoB-associated Cys-rich membrane protein [Pasteurella skyensis]|uniref:FeoB-associated Cys-rich membrane protein n=1 Tax=Phocoenobacter skyensis TaxID=97481 RepID=UPI002758799E|nr:FeoB-associated Cys-rich membrane protein [Pasteurella skyensis]MDP8177737.1 FeoB-associated Cys-rich membrane protein [Pasteurella skyensis]MDP8200376.1 FeoB-associated Cys-rich membrane protein [Pasteurella skyensis]